KGLRQPVPFHIGEGRCQRRDRFPIPGGARREGAIRAESRRGRIRIIIDENRVLTVDKTESVSSRMMATPAVTGLKHVKAKVCLVGDVAVGKTSLIRRFVQDEFDDRYIATVGTKVTNKTVEVEWRGAAAMLDMIVWDIMGEKGFRALLRDAYLEVLHGVIAVGGQKRHDTCEDLNIWVKII